CIVRVHVRTYSHDAVARDRHAAGPIHRELLIHRQDGGIGEQEIAGSAHERKLSRGPPASRTVAGRVGFGRASAGPSTINAEPAESAENITRPQCPALAGPANKVAAPLNQFDSSVASDAARTGDPLGLTRRPARRRS